MSIIFGLGSGRCGTKTLQALINLQPNSVCFHEVNPSAMAWSGAKSSVLSLLSDFSLAVEGGDRYLSVDYDSPNRDKPLKRYFTMSKVDNVGDVASYYLPYVADIINKNEDVVFPCIIREREQVIQSFINKVKVTDSSFKKIYFLLQGKLPYRNHWSTSKKYIRDPKWDRLHPTMGGKLNLYDAISSYYDFYYEEVERLISNYSNVKLFSINDFNNKEGREKLLKFCGVSNPVLNSEVHENARD